MIIHITCPLIMNYCRPDIYIKLIPKIKLKKSFALNSTHIMVHNNMTNNYVRSGKFLFRDFPKFVYFLNMENVY